MNTFIFSATSGKKGESLLYNTDDGKVPFFIKEDNKDSCNICHNKVYKVCNCKPVVNKKGDQN